MRKPIEVLRSGAIQAAIWRVEAQQPFYTVSVSRSYRDATGDWRETANFRARDLPELVRLLLDAEEWINKASASPKTGGQQRLEDGGDA